jgi:hypothetical protein
MTWFLRKSLRLGPLRLNLSKRGLGGSIGWALRAIIGVAILIVVMLVFGGLGLGRSDGIYFATALILLWYTIETEASRRQLVLANELAVRPLLVASIDGLWTDQLVLKNLGNGPALFVRVRDLQLGAEATVQFDVKAVVAAEDSVVVAPSAQIQGGTTDWGAAAIANLKPSAPDPHDVVIDYEDLNGRRRSTTMRMGQGGIRLLSRT